MKTFKNINLKGVTTETWVRTAVFFISLVGSILFICGVIDTEPEAEKIEAIAALIVNAFVSLYSWWMNNSFTKGAQQGDILMNEVNNGEK